MKKYLHFFTIITTATYAESSFWSSSYSSSSSSEQAAVNGKIVKSKERRRSHKDEMAGKNNQILYQKHNAAQNEEDKNAQEGIECSGEDYASFVVPEKAKKEFAKMIKLVTGSCSIAPTNQGFSNTQVSVVTKNAQRNAIGDFIFGIFGTSDKELSQALAVDMVRGFVENQGLSDIQLMVLGLQDVKELDDAQYTGELGLGLGILRDLDTRKKLTLWCPFNTTAFIYHKGASDVCPTEDMKIIDDVSKGDIIIFATNNFWKVIEQRQALYIARRNFKRKDNVGSATSVAKTLIRLARDKGCNEQMNVLVIYIL